jgi:type IV secretory pathway component VirB8
VAVDRSVRLFAELFGDPQVHAARWFVISAIALVGNIVQTSAIIGMLPLKRVVPYVVEATNNGVTARVVEASQYRPNTAMIKAELARWADDLMALDPYQTRDKLRRSTLVLRGKAVAEHSDFMKTYKPFERLIEAPTLIRTVQINTVDASQDGLAFLFFTTTERSNGEPTLKRWRLSVQYAVMTPEDEKELLANPAGLVITHFELQQEIG